ncbi:MAG: methylmalonyl-CoA mutase family protein [Caldilineaceae bacterium]
MAKMKRWPCPPKSRWKLRCQQIIAHESGVADTADPLGGSYYIEWLTDQIEVQATDYIAHFHSNGRALRAVEEGFIQREIKTPPIRRSAKSKAASRSSWASIASKPLKNQWPICCVPMKACAPAQMAQLKQLRFQRRQRLRSADIGPHRTSRPPT